MEKNGCFHRRLGFAFTGLWAAARSERSFQTQIVCTVAALAWLAYFRAPAVWWALFSLSIGGVLGAELVNTAFENVIDHLHPDHHPKIGLAKDIAAGAVLVFSLAAVAVFAAFCVSHFTS